MAFSRENLDPTGSGSKGTGLIGIYSTTSDAKATVNGAGYFNSVSAEMARIRMILIEATDETYFAKVTVANGVVTLSAPDTFA